MDVERRGREERRFLWLEVGGLGWRRKEVDALFSWVNGG